MKSWRDTLHEVIFEADTPSGKTFDLALLWLILLSVLTVLLESIPELKSQYAEAFYYAEWTFTGLFTLEYVLRLIAVRKPIKYATSFFGIVDLLAILPTFVGLLVPGSASLRVVRILRLLRLFRILKLVGFLKEARALQSALRTAKQRILVFLSVVIALVTIIGTLMYLIEDGQSGFTSIPRSIYWAIVTVTTVGYGDIVPATAVGKVLASFMMIIGYAIIAVPGGILGIAVMQQSQLDSLNPDEVSTVACPSCGRDGHESDADFCKHCGNPL